MTVKTDDTEYRKKGTEYQHCWQTGVAKEALAQSSRRNETVHVRIVTAPRRYAVAVHQRGASATMTTGNADASVPDAGAAPGDPRRGLRQEPGRSERIARAAREIFARDGLNVGYNEVARAAGVGVGTVYRRYPTREALIVAAVGASHDQLAEIAADALATADPWEALVTFLERGLDLLSGNLGLRDVALGSYPAGDRPAGLSHWFGPVMGQLLERASAAGRLRDGVTAADLLVLQCALTELARHSRGVYEACPRRYLQIFIDGMEHRDGQPGLGPGASPVQAREVIRAWTAPARRQQARDGRGG